MIDFELKKDIEDREIFNYETVVVSTTDEIPIGKMKHVEVRGEEILIANIEGKYYAISDRCGHANASLSKGILNGKIVTCPLHGAQFDVTTGKKIKDFHLDNPSSDTLPENFKRYIEYTLPLVKAIKTHDQNQYDLFVEDNQIKIKIPLSHNG
jgi:nitrite reductase/ring-hydroxylating ferredoxin subunit